MFSYMLVIAKYSYFESVIFFMIYLKVSSACRNKNEQSSCFDDFFAIIFIESNLRYEGDNLHLAGSCQKDSEVSCLHTWMPCVNGP